MYNCGKWCYVFPQICAAVILESGTKFISQVLFNLKAQSMYSMLVLCWHQMKNFRKWHLPKFSSNQSFSCLKKYLAVVFRWSGWLSSLPLMLSLGFSTLFDSFSIEK
jgi:hypothetical protein